MSCVFAGKPKPKEEESDRDDEGIKEYDNDMTPPERDTVGDTHPSSLEVDYEDDSPSGVDDKTQSEPGFFEPRRRRTNVSNTGNRKRKQSAETTTMRSRAKGDKSRQNNKRKSARPKTRPNDIEDEEVDTGDFSTSTEATRVMHDGHSHAGKPGPLDWNYEGNNFNSQSICKTNVTKFVVRGGTMGTSVPFLWWIFSVSH